MATLTAATSTTTANRLIASAATVAVVVVVVVSDLPQIECRTRSDHRRLWQWLRSVDSF